MHIDVKLYGDLKKYAPGDQASFMLTLEPGATLADVLNRLAIPDAHYLSLINGRRANKEVRFEGGETLVLLPPISGG